MPAKPISRNPNAGTGASRVRPDHRRVNQITGKSPGVKASGLFSCDARSVKRVVDHIQDTVVVNIHEQRIGTIADPARTGRRRRQTEQAVIEIIGRRQKDAGQKLAAISMAIVPAARIGERRSPHGRILPPAEIEEPAAIPLAAEIPSVIAPVVAEIASVVTSAVAEIAIAVLHDIRVRPSLPGRDLCRVWSAASAFARNIGPRA